MVDVYYAGAIVRCTEYLATRDFNFTTERLPGKYEVGHFCTRIKVARVVGHPVYTCRFQVRYCALDEVIYPYIRGEYGDE